MNVCWKCLNMLLLSHLIILTDPFLINKTVHMTNTVQLKWLPSYCHWDKWVNGHLSPGGNRPFGLNKLFRGIIALSFNGLYNPEYSCTIVFISFYPQQPSLGIALYIFGKVTLSCECKALHRNSQQQGNCIGCFGQVCGAGVLYWARLPPPPMLLQSFFSSFWHRKLSFCSVSSILFPTGLFER